MEVTPALPDTRISPSADISDPDSELVSSGQYMEYGIDSVSDDLAGARTVDFTPWVMLMFLLNSGGPVLSFMFRHVLG